VCEDAATLLRSVQVVITSLPSAAASMDTAEAIASAGAKGLLVIEIRTLDAKDKEAALSLMAKKGWCCSIAPCRVLVLKLCAKT